MYKVKGADQKEYGPISADQVKQWIAENRLNGFSLAQNESQPGWKPLSQFPEFQESLRVQSPPPVAASTPPPASPSQSIPQSSTPQSSGRPQWGPAASPSYSRARPSAGTREFALSEVQGPSMGLIVCGVLGLLLSILNIPLHFLGNQAIPVPGNITDPEVRQAIADVLAASKQFGLVSAIFGIPWNAFTLYSGIKMRSLQSHTLCFVGAVLTALPCFSACCCVSLPIGIWAAVVLAKPEIKEHFQ